MSKNALTEEAKTVIIDGVTYEFYHLSIRTLNKIVLRVFKLIGKSMADNLTTDFGLDTIDKIDKVALTRKIIDMLSEHLNVDAVDEIIVELLSATVCPGKGSVKKNFDDVFDSDIVHMWRVVIEAGKYYFSSFFEKGLEIFMKIREEEQKKKEAEKNKEKVD